ncbi:hypothetical protein [Eisenbergiella porci]|uniref:hypothetical protein n=1 Tax=Eisenbergiella porci TaxID=2652274 RepID=UPI002A82A24A|nr:hypothetical protein [Eisenbergiella porci]
MVRWRNECGRPGWFGAAGGAELGMEQRTGEQKVRKETAGWKSGSGRGGAGEEIGWICVLFC